MCKIYPAERVVPIGHCPGCRCCCFVATRCTPSHRAIRCWCHIDFYNLMIRKLGGNVPTRCKPTAGSGMRMTCSHVQVGGPINRSISHVACQMFRAHIAWYALLYIKCVCLCSEMCALAYVYWGGGWGSNYDRSTNRAQRTFLFSNCDLTPVSMKNIVFSRHLWTDCL